MKDLFMEAKSLGKDTWAIPTLNSDTIKSGAK